MARAERASDAFGLVFALVLTTYVLTSLIPLKGWTAVLITLTSSATSVVALTSAKARHGLVQAAIVLSALSMVLAVVGAIAGGHIWYSITSLIQVGLLTVAMLAVLRRVVTAEKVGARTIIGALSVYTVLGLLFTFLYSVIDRLQSGPFFEGVAAPAGSDFLFFSYTTLTTTGYGDLVPGGQPGQMVAGLEMMIGQVFLVTLVAGLVSLWRPGEGLRRRRERREGTSAPEASEPA